MLITERWKNNCCHEGTKTRKLLVVRKWEEFYDLRIEECECGKSEKVEGCVYENTNT